jgi:UDP-glucose 4-epimerase
MAKHLRKVLVTGGAGYIGSHTIIELLEKSSYEVVAIDNFSNSTSKTYERIRTITGKEFSHYDVDLTDYAKTKEVFEKEKNISEVIHFAAFKEVGESVENPIKYYQNNLNSLINVLVLSGEFNVENFIFSSSCSVYGNIDQLPVKEDTPLNRAESPYAATKQMGERILEDYARSNQALKIIALRYFNPVGAHLSGLNGELPLNKPNSLVPVVTQTAAGIRSEMFINGNDYPTRDGTCIRDYIHVLDIASGHIAALDYLVQQHKSATNYAVFNLGTGQGVSVAEAIHAFEKTTGVKLNYKIAPRRPGDVVAIYSDTVKSSSTLKWEPKYSLEEMMSSAWKWQQQISKE